METQVFYIDSDTQLMVRTDDPFLDNMTMDPDMTYEGVHVYMYGLFDDVPSPYGILDEVTILSSFALSDEELTPGAVYTLSPSTFYIDDSQSIGGIYRDDEELTGEAFREAYDHYLDFFSSYVRDTGITMEVRVLGADE